MAIAATTESVSAKLRKDEKDRFSAICDEIGTSPSNAIRMFVSAFNRRGGFPFDPSNPYFDPKSSKEAPRWFAVDVRVVAPCGLISIQTLRNDPELARLIILKRGIRLSVTPVAPEDFERIRTQHMHF